MTSQAYVLLLYNPKSGMGEFTSMIDYFLEVMQGTGHEVMIHRMEEKSSFSDYLKTKDLSLCEAVFIAGGDGSINSLVNHFVKYDLDIPIGILPAGTSNDFATFLGISDNLSEAIETLSGFRTKYVDVGKVNNRYFINVCSGGFFTNVAHTVDLEAKQMLGRLAYYIKGVQQVAKFRPLPYRFNIDGEQIEENMFLFLVMNSPVTGGFDRLAVRARVDDGKLDFIGIKEVQVAQIANVFRKILQGDHLEDENIIYRQCQHVKVELLDDLAEFKESDIDGEAGPRYPLDIEVIEKRIRIIY